MKTLRAIHTQADKITAKIFEEKFNYGKRPYDISDNVIIGLFENMIGKTKSLLILLEKEHYFSLETISRSVFESYIYLSYILEEDTELRAKSFALSTRTEEYKLYRALTEKGKSGRKLRAFLGKTEDDLKNIINDTDSYFNNRLTIFDDVLEKRDENSKWYNLYRNSEKNKGKGITNIEQLCSHLDLEVEYSLIYRLLSRDVHSGDVMNLIDIRKEEGEIKREQQSNQRAFIGVKKQKFDTDLPVVICSQSLYKSTQLVCDYYNLKKQKKNFEVLVGINHKLGMN